MGGKNIEFLSPGQSPSYLVNKEQRRLFAQESAGEGTLFKGVLGEGAGDLLLTEERAVYTVLRTPSLPPSASAHTFPSSRLPPSLQNPSLISPSLLHTYLSAGSI